MEDNWTSRSTWIDVREGHSGCFNGQFSLRYDGRAKLQEVGAIYLASNGLSQTKPTRKKTSRFNRQCADKANLKLKFYPFIRGVFNLKRAKPRS